MKSRFSTSIIVIVLLVSSCKKDKPQPEKPGSVNTSAGAQKVFVVNEGNFGKTNASVSLYDPATGTVEENRFSAQNSGEKLGDVAQFMLKDGDEYFIVVNNSNKITVCDLDLKKRGEITGLVAPRYIQPIGNGLAYVSQYKWGGAVALVDLGKRQVLKQIAVSGMGEQMVHFSGKVYLANSASQYLYVLDEATHALADSIDVGYGGNSVVLDRNNRLWVLTQGNWNGPEQPSIVRVDPSSGAVEMRRDFSKQDFINKITLNPSRDTLFYLHNGVARWPVNDAGPSHFITTSGFALNGIRVNPRTHHVYVSDAVDYSQRSLITIYSAAGDSLNSFRAGIIAGDFLFD